MDKGPSKDDLTEKSEKRIKEDSGRQYAEDKLKGTTNKTDSEVGKIDSFLDGEESKSEEPTKTGIPPTKSFNWIETLKEEGKSEMRDELKHIKSSTNFKQNLLASEKRVQEDDTKEENVKIEVDGKEQGTTSVIKEIHEESRTSNTEKDHVRINEEDKLKGTRSKVESKEEKLDDSLDEEGSKADEPSKTGMRPSKLLNRVEALKQGKKSQIQGDPKSSEDFKRQLLALESELSLESIERKTTGIFLPSSLKKKASITPETPELDSKPQRKGISNMMAIILIVASATGSAFQSLPFHLRESTWFGVFFFLLLGLNSLYACLCTGWCWSLMEDLWPEYLAWSRVPYQDMAYRAVGPWMKYIVAALVDATLLIMCCNYIISVSEIIGEFLYPHVTICYFIIIVTVVLSFSSMLGSYRNIKYIGVTDVILSLVFLVSIVICLFYDQRKHGSRDYSQSHHESIIMAFAGMSYAFGTGIIMPNILVEMEDRSKFTESCVTAYMIILAIYTVIAILGYAAYGSKTTSHITKFILESDSLRKFGIFIDIIQALQLATTFAMYFLPLALALEEMFKCPDRFCTPRAAIRLVTMIIIMLIILGVPRMITHMDVIAATSLNILSFILPPILNVLLLRKQKVTPSRKTQSLKELILVVETLLLAIIIGIVGIYVSLKNAIAYAPGYLSCYFNMSLYPLR